MGRRKYLAPDKCPSCEKMIQVPPGRTWRLQCGHCLEWVTNAPPKKPEVDMSMLKADLLKVAEGMGLDVTDRNTKAGIIEAIEGAS